VDVCFEVYPLRLRKTTTKGPGDRQALFLLSAIHKHLENQIGIASQSNSNLQRRLLQCVQNSTGTAFSAFESMNKRRRGFPSEKQVKRGVRIVHDDKTLEEKLGRDDLCPCWSGRRFQEVLHGPWPLSTGGGANTTSATSRRSRVHSRALTGRELDLGSSCFARRRLGVRISPDPPTGPSSNGRPSRSQRQDAGSSPAGPTRQTQNFTKEVKTWS
jgi:hypothetical protein